MTAAGLVAVVSLAVAVGLAAAVDQVAAAVAVATAVLTTCSSRTHPPRPHSAMRSTPLSPAPPHNLRVFYSRDGHLHGAATGVGMGAAMHHHATTSRVFLCVVSEQYAQSGYCRGELNAAWDNTNAFGVPSWIVVNGGSTAPHAPHAHGGEPAWHPGGCPGGWEPPCFTRSAQTLPFPLQVIANNLSMVYVHLRAMDGPRRDMRGDPDLPRAPPPQLNDRQREVIRIIGVDVRTLLGKMAQM